MFDVCPACGLYREDKTIDPNGPVAICPECGHRQPFRQLPLFVITGASGSGKSTLGLALMQAYTDGVVFDCDVLWQPVYNTPETDYRAFRNLCLRVAKNISQGGRPVVLVGSAIPKQYEQVPQRRYFTAIHYLTLTCDDAALIQRLRARPAWRHTSDPATLQTTLAFNRWLIDNAESTAPPMTRLDTTALSIDETVAYTVEWIGRVWPHGTTG